ncbi:MAG: hypothetical protein FWD49_06110 [Firmicutes bacterium]|nr:hypothetical protein [Bacillota bacterium]
MKSFVYRSLVKCCFATWWNAKSNQFMRACPHFMRHWRTSQACNARDFTSKLVCVFTRRSRLHAPRAHFTSVSVFTRQRRTSQCKADYSLCITLLIA